MLSQFKFSDPLQSVSTSWSHSSQVVRREDNVKDTTKYWETKQMIDPPQHITPHGTNHLIIIKHCCSTHTRDKSEMKEKNTRRKTCCVSGPPHTLFGSPVDQGLNSAARWFYPQSEKIASGTAAHRQRFTFVGYAIEWLPTRQLECSITSISGRVRNTIERYWAVYTTWLELVLPPLGFPPAAALYFYYFTIYRLFRLTAYCFSNQSLIYATLHCQSDLASTLEAQQTASENNIERQERRKKK